MHVIYVVKFSQSRVRTQSTTVFSLCLLVICTLHNDTSPQTDQQRISLNEQAVYRKHPHTFLYTLLGNMTILDRVYIFAQQTQCYISVIILSIKSYYIFFIRKLSPSAEAFLAFHDFNTRPFNETCMITHKRAGTRPAQFTHSIYCSCHLYEKFTSRY